MPRDQLWNVARKNSFGLPACLARCECGAYNLTGKVTFLKICTVGYCPQNATKPALKYQPVEMRLLSLCVMVREGQGLCPLQPVALQAFSCAIYRSLFSPDLLLCLYACPSQREVSRGGDMLQSGIYCSASFLSLACMGSPGLCPLHHWGPQPPCKASFFRKGPGEEATFPCVHSLVSHFPGCSHRAASNGTTGVPGTQLPWKAACVAPTLGLACDPPVRPAHSRATGVA